jgi:hypothetical protein
MSHAKTTVLQLVQAAIIRFQVLVVFETIKKNYAGSENHSPH